MIFSAKRKNLPGTHRKEIRSDLRLFFGKIYFLSKRYCQWFFERKSFAKTLISDSQIDFETPFIISKHSSPIYRELKDVDMSLQKNKETNLNIAIKNLHGLRLEQGLVFSFWYLVGKPTKGKGYLPGMQLKNGGYVAKTGGGLCQLANLIYWMTLHSPLSVKERWRHSFDIFPDSNRTLPFGSGATVSYNYIDLQIQNNTKQDYILKLWISDGNLFGEWRSEIKVPYSYQVYESSHAFHPEPWGGYTRRNTIRRKVLDLKGNNIIKDELITENVAWMMYEPLLAAESSKEE